MAERICNNCGFSKPLDAYWADRSFADGKSTICKHCQREYQRRYESTPRGMALKMWRGMKKRALNKSGKDKSYANVRIMMTRQQWLDWAVPEIALFMRSNPGETPSIDRIDPSGDYAFGNVRIIAWSVHRTLKKKAKDVRDRQRLRDYLATIPDHQRRVPIDQLPQDLKPLPPKPPVILPSPPVKPGSTVSPNQDWIFW